MKDRAQTRLAHFSESTGFVQEFNEVFDARLRSEESRGGLIFENWPVVCVVVALVEGVFSGLEVMLDFWGSASAPGCFRGAKLLVEFTSVSMAGEGLGESTKEFTGGGAEHIVGRDLWRVDVHEFETRGSV